MTRETEVHRIGDRMQDGNYAGMWGGHRLAFVYSGDHIEFDTDRGVRGVNVPVTFSIVDGELVEGSILPIEFAPINQPDE